MWDSTGGFTTLVLIASISVTGTAESVSVSQEEERSTLPASWFSAGYNDRTVSDGDEDFTIEHDVETPSHPQIVRGCT